MNMIKIITELARPAAEYYWCGSCRGYARDRSKWIEGIETSPYKSHYGNYRKKPLHYPV